VLLASVPPGVGAVPASVRAARRHPLAFALCNLKLSLYPLLATPDLGHDLMLDRGWERVAERIDQWLKQRGLDN